MGVLDVFSAQADTGAPNPVQALPRDLGERVGASADVIFAPNRYFTLQGARRDMYQRAIDELHASTGETLPNPAGAMSGEEMMRLGNQPAVQQERLDKLVQANRALRETNPDAFNVENVDRYIGLASERAEQKAASYEGTGNGVGNFLANVGMSSIEPANVPFFFLPVSRLPLAAAGSIGRTFLGNVSREAALQGGAAAGFGALSAALDYSAKSETGTPPSLVDVATGVGEQALLGGVLGGGLRALHLKWLGLPKAARDAAPTEVKDAFRIIEADQLYSGQNRLGVDPMLHERYQGRAMDAVMRGTPVDLADLSRTADTPMTALSTILRQTPEVRGIRPEINPLIGTPDEGMRMAFGNAVQRLQALPDSEIEAFARETRPRSFERLDRVEAELQAARSRLADIEGRTPSAADLLDPDTALRLQDIEADLAAPGLRRQRRDQLEQEREMIMATVDPRDRLPKQAERAQRAQIAEAQKEVDRLAGPHAEARATADAAVVDLRRKLGRYAEEFEPATIHQTIAQDLGLPSGADLGLAIQRADMMRQARMVREVLPEPAPPEFNRASVKGASEGIQPAGAGEPTPEQIAALDRQAVSILEDRGRIGEFRAVATKELAAADQTIRDAQAALNCAMGSL